MENEKRDVHDKDVGFKLEAIDISSIRNFDDENYSYIFVLSCHGSELDAQRRTIANEDCFFNSIALGTRFGHLGYTDAHNNKAIPLHEENNWVNETNGADIINRLSLVNSNFSNDQNNNEAYFIENLTTDPLPIITENEGQNIYTGLNPMTFEIKKSDYEGMLLDPSAIAQDPSANEAHTKSRIYINAFGLWVYKCYKFRANLNNEKKNTVDLDIAINKRQLKGIYNDEELHRYFSNTENRNINNLTEKKQLRIRHDIRSYMEPGQKCTWNILINMCYDAISELHTEQLYNDIYEKNWNLRVLCCREASGSVSSSTTSFVVNRDSINYTPELIDDSGNDNFVPFMNNIISNEHIESIFNNLLYYLNTIYDAFKLVARTNNNNIVHFITGHYQLLLVFQLLTIINPIIGDIYNNYNFRKLAFRIYTITIQNDQYDLFDALLTLTANKNSVSKRYSRKKVSLLGNPTNKRIYMEELLDKLNTAIDNNNGIAVGIQGNLRTYLIEALNNGGNSDDYPDAKFIIDSIIMLTKRQNFMNDYDEIININVENDEDTMDIEEDYLAFDFGTTEQRDISTLIDDSQYLGLIGDDIFNNVYAQYIKYIHSEIDNFDSHICIYFTAAKEVNEENKKIEEAVFVFILDITQDFTNVVSYLIGLNNDSFMSREEFGGVKWREDYTDRILNYREGKGVMFQENYEDNNDIKVLINNFVYYGCIIPLYRNGFNYIDLIYRYRNTMTGGGPIPKNKSVDPNHPLIIDLDKSSDEDKTDESEYRLPLKNIPELKNVNKVEFKDTFQRDKNFVSNDDIGELPVNPDSIFPLGRFVEQLQTPTDQGITKREPSSQHSDFIIYQPPFSLPSSPGSPLSKVQSAPGNLGFGEDFPITDDDTPFNTPSIVRRRPRTKPTNVHKSAPELNIYKNVPAVTITRSPSEQEIFNSQQRVRNIEKEIEKEIGNVKDDDVGMDIEKPGGKKRKSKKLKVKRNKGKTKKKSVKKK